MKITTALSLALVSASLVTGGVAAKADTAPHAVYEQKIAPDDGFSILDKYQNNVLTAEEYNNGSNTAPFRAVDANHDGFITREEFYNYNHKAAEIRSEDELEGKAAPRLGHVDKGM